MLAPFTFKLQGREWSVTVLKPDDVLLKTDSGVAAMGMTYPRTCRIYLASDLTSQMLKVVLYHELTHAILDPIDDSLEDEETICQVNANAMLELLPQMKGWPKWTR
jgi:Zn-dependent peptidase ImmA (M78 family)